MSSRRPLVALFALACGCGTVVGNPKKPTQPTEQAPSMVRSDLHLPLLGFTLPDSASTDDASLTGEGASLALASDDDNVAGGEKTVLAQLGRRSNNMLTTIDNVAARINKILDTDPDPDGNGGVTFKNRGDQGRLSGRVGASSDKDYEYEAVLCQDDKAFTVLRWRDAGARLELTRDFASKVDPADADLDLVARLSYQKTAAATALTIGSFGRNPDVVGVDGDGIAERIEFSRAPDNVLTVRSVTDRFATAPADGVFEGDQYITGVITPATDGKAETLAFVGWFKGLAGTGACRLGFDESSPTLWHPPLAGPRFCIGRPETGKRFLTAVSFYDTLTKLQPIGVAPKHLLEKVTMPATPTCP